MRWRSSRNVPLLMALVRPAGPAGAAPPAAVYYPGPGDAWERRDPEAVGMDGAGVREAVAFAVANETGSPRDLALEHALSYAKEPYDDPIGAFTVERPRGGGALDRQQGQGRPRPARHRGCLRTVTGGKNP